MGYKKNWKYRENCKIQEDKEHGKGGKQEKIKHEEYKNDYEQEIMRKIENEDIHEIQT